MEWDTIARGAMVIFPALFLFGPASAPVFVIGLLFLKKLTMLRTRLIGPPLMNQALVAERTRGLVVFALVVIGSAVAWMVLIKVFPGDAQRSVAIVVIAAFLAVVWFRPSMAVVPVLCVTAFGGSGMLLVAVPLIVMLARRDQRCRLKITRSVGRTAMTLVYALAGFVAVLLFANASAGTPRPDSASVSEQTPASPTGDGSWFNQFSNWLLQRGDGVDTSTPSRLVQVPGQEQTGPPNDSTPWQLWLALAVGAVLLVGAAAWLYRRRRGVGRELRDSGAALTLARLEAIGAAVGRRRASNEGALTFASKLATYTGDTRLEEAGPLVSGDVYGTNAVEPQLVSTQLTKVEANPPPPPPPPPLKDRLADRVRSLPITRRGAVVSAASLIGLGALVWFAAPSLGDLREPTGRELAYVEQADAPDEWHTLMGASTNELIGWESCSSGYGNDALGWVQVGLLHRTESLGAVLDTFGGDGDAVFGSLQVGTDSLTATISVIGNGVGPSFADEPWRISDWSSVVTRPFANIDDVLSTTVVHEPNRSDYVDRNGDFFVRYESLPPKREDVYANDAPVSPIMLDDLNLMRIVDIWTDDNGIPVRVRTIADGPDGQWIEWRRIDEVGDVRLARPSCEPEWPWANNDWIGYESWTASRVVPLQIDLDDQGNPYDSFSWATGDLTVEPSGTIDGPIDVLSFGDLYSISPETEDDVEDGFEYESPDYESTFDLQWDAGAEITLIRSDEWPAATRIDAVGESVEEWDDFESFYIYESFVTVVASSTFPVIEPDELDILIEPLWNGETQVAASVDEKPGNELTLLTQSDSTSLVVGRNGRGEIVSIIVWDDWNEWRSFGFEGTPPPSIIEREAQLRACIAGDVQVDLAGRCPWQD